MGVNARRRHWAKAFLNFWMAWSNYVVLGCPDCKGAGLEPQGGFRCQAEVRDYTESLLGEVEKFIDRDFCIEKISFGGDRRLMDEALKSLQKMDACYGTPGKSRGVSSHKVNVALPVRADRVAIPENAGTVNPLEWLPVSRQAAVADLTSLRLPEEAWGKPITACHQLDRREENKLMRRLLESNMVKLIPEACLPRTESGSLLIGGFFCVAKNDQEDRLIYDRRPENRTMRRLDWAKLPSGACFTRLLLQPEEFLRGSGDDLRTFYFSLALPENWIPYNAVGRRVDPAIVKLWGGDPKIPYRAAMKVLGMGDLNACDIAQAVHEHVLRVHGLLFPETTMIYGEPIPQGDVLEGAYLDDLLIVGKLRCRFPIPLDGSFKPPIAKPQDADLQQVHKAEQAYLNAGLARALHKSFRAETVFKAWGASIDGIQGTASVPVEVRRQVWWLCCQIISGGVSTKNILQRLLGYICFCFQFRRECFALQHHIHKFVEQMDDIRMYRLPAFVLDELRSMMMHIPFCCWNMRRGFSPTILATDATPTSGGATRAHASEKLQAKLWQLCEIKGEAVRLDRTLSELDWNGGEAPTEPSQFASRTAECLPWTATASYHFRETAHINLQEARALKREIVSMANDPSARGQIQICLNDSRVVVGAVSKGRSSSFRLNGILRSMLPFLILARIALGLLWVETECNPADYPSRFKLVPPPSTPPSWLSILGVTGIVLPGLEIFAGSARLTKACRKYGVDMLDPIDILWGVDAMEHWIDELLCHGLVGWIWLAPPCSSRLWGRALQLARLAHKHGVFFFIEHPRHSDAWILKETQRNFNLAGVFSLVVDWCAYDDYEQVVPPSWKPTRILGTGPWLKDIGRNGPGSHVHGPPLNRGARAKVAGTYPWEFFFEYR